MNVSNFNNPFVNSFKPEVHSVEMGSTHLTNAFRNNNYAFVGPDHWADLDGKNSACTEKNQSPIDIKTGDVVYKRLMTTFTMKGYDNVQGTLRLTNNGHTGKSS